MILSIQTFYSSCHLEPTRLANIDSAQNKKPQNVFHAKFIHEEETRIDSFCCRIDALSPLLVKCTNSIIAATMNYAIESELNTILVGSERFPGDESACFELHFLFMRTAKVHEAWRS